jgi:hypothetical protein
MAAVFAAVVRAPLTAIILVFELTGDYELVLPLMLAVGIASFGADRLGWRSIYVEGLRRRGVTLDRPDDVDVLQLVAVREVMTRASAPDATVRDDVPSTRCASASRARACTGRSWSMRGCARRRRRTLRPRPPGSGPAPMRPLRTSPPTSRRDPRPAVPDEPVFRAVQRMANLDVGRLPVVEPVDRPGRRRVPARGRRARLRPRHRAHRRRAHVTATPAGCATSPGSRRCGSSSRRIGRRRRARSARSAGRSARSSPGVQRGTEAIVPGGDTGCRRGRRRRAHRPPGRAASLLLTPTHPPPGSPAPTPTPGPDLATAPEEDA